MDESPKLLFIVGPSGVGKSHWAIEWAKQIHSTGQAVGILNCDSIQIYKDLNIGSAKPDFVKYPDISFYLYNQIPAPKLCTAGLFRKKALQILTDKLSKEIIIATGGSGFYLQALEKGMFPVAPSSALGLSPSQSPSSPPDPSSLPDMSCPRKRASNTKKTLTLSELYQSLKQKDPLAASRISPKDRYRILRALELINQEGKTLSSLQSEFKEQKLPWPYLKIGLSIPKDELLKRIQKRTKFMLKSGLIEEVEKLLQRGLKAWRPLNSIGYKETQQYLEGLMTKEELEADIVRNTMRLAKKQKTWFKKDTSIQWFDWNLAPLKVYKQLFKC